MEACLQQRIARAARFSKINKFKSFTESLKILKYLRAAAADAAIPRSAVVLDGAGSISCIGLECEFTSKKKVKTQRQEQNHRLSIFLGAKVDSQTLLDVGEGKQIRISCSWILDDTLDGVEQFYPLSQL
jgi:hypothetical protein